MTAPAVVLASRSPRRLDILSLLVPRERIRVLPPSSPDEAGFAELNDLTAIKSRLREIAASKCDDVCRQLGASAASSIVVAADTIVVVESADSTALAPNYLVLGQPPEDHWRETARRWFLDHYAGRTHSVFTAVNIMTPGGRSESIVETRVTFRANVAADLDWYLDTAESPGKAGGYALQGAGSLFIERVEGSLTNVIGLPLEALRDLWPDDSCEL